MPNITCSVDDCEKPVLAKELCRLHYSRKRIHGTTDLVPRKQAPKKPVAPCSFDGCEVDSRARGFCWTHYQQKYRRGGDMRPYAFADTPRADRFWAKVEKTATCWNWTGATNGAGYGKFWATDADHVMAYRYSFELANGPIPAGLVIDHKCRNSLCVNPEHLRAITHKQNLEHLKGANANSSTGVRGVHWDSSRSKYAASVRHNGKDHVLGRFDSLEEADRAVRAKRAELFTHDDAEY